MERFTKALVVVSLLAAVYFEASLSYSAWALFPTLTMLALAAGFVYGSLDPGFAPRLVLFFSYITPAIFIATLGQFRIAFPLIWTAALVGLMLAAPGAARWSWPRRWKFALILWALTIACVWPFVALREYDYSTLLMHSVAPENGSARIIAVESASWVMDVAILHLVGLLWLDWLFRRYTPERLEAFLHEVLMPLAASAIVTSAVGIYQGVFDLKFLSAGIWPDMRRAAGAMADANSFGMIAALWSAGVIALMACLRVRWWPWIASAASLICWAGLWMSGSRTAFVAAAIGLAFAAFGVVFSAPRIGRARALTAAAVLAGGVIVALALVPARSDTPIARLRSSLPSPTPQAVLTFSKELWNRNEYGAVSGQMIAEFPLAGVGVGGFHSLAPEYTYLINAVRLPPDNAQNWFRHQFAELGAIGSIGWILWVVMFAVFLLRTRAAGNQRLPATVVKGIIVALALVSLVGMPTQNLAVTLIFWTFVFWYVVLVSPTETLTTDRAPLLPIAWAAMFAIVACQVGVTAYTGRHSLRVPERAARFDWRYSYGMSWPRMSGGMEYRWTADHAIAVIPVDKRLLRLTVWAAHPDLSTQPVHARVSVNGDSVLDTTISDTTPIVRDVRLPDGSNRVWIEAWVDRTWQPESRLGEEHPSARGLAVAWTFVDPSASGR